MLEFRDALFGCIRYVANLIYTCGLRCQSCRRCDIVHEGWGSGILRVLSVPFIDSIFDKASRDVLRGELTVRKNNLSFGVLLTLSVIDI